MSAQNSVHLCFRRLLQLHLGRGAVLAADQSFESAQRQFDRYPEFYQGDVQDLRPRFVRVAA